MGSFLAGIFSQGSFIPHGFCLAWEPGLLWLHVISDSVIALSYYSIPFAILYFISRRRDFEGDQIRAFSLPTASGNLHNTGKTKGQFRW